MAAEEAPNPLPLERPLTPPFSRGSGPLPCPPNQGSKFRTPPSKSGGLGTLLPTYASVLLPLPRMAPKEWVKRGLHNATGQTKAAQKTHWYKDVYKDGITHHQSPIGQIVSWDSYEFSTLPQWHHLNLCHLCRWISMAVIIPDFSALMTPS